MGRYFLTFAEVGSVRQESIASKKTKSQNEKNPLELKHLSRLSACLHNDSICASIFHLVLRLWVSLASFRPATIVPRDPQCLLPWFVPLSLRYWKKKKKQPGTGRPQDRRKKKKKKTARDRTTLRPKKKISYREPVFLFSSHCDSLGDCAALRLALQAICH